MANKPKVKPAEPAKKIVRMVRDAAAYPAPHEADVHPDEVENYAAGGWGIRRNEA